MSIKSEISRITANVRDSFTALSETGVATSVTENTSDTLPDAIRNSYEEINTLLDSINGEVI